MEEKQDAKTPESGPKKKNDGFRWYEIVAALGVLAIIAFLIINNLEPSKSTTMKSCENNLELISRALAKYAEDHDGLYPKSLKELTPGYIKEIPVCPAAGKDTYSKGYRASAERKAYVVCCKGKNHEEIPSEDYPMFTSTKGLIKKP